MIRVDFDVPSYLRLQQGLCIVSERLVSRGGERPPTGGSDAREPVVINRLYRPGDHPQGAEVERREGPVISGEYLAGDRQPEAAVPALAPVADPEGIECAAEINFQGMVGKSVTGIYGGSGMAYYRFSKRNGKSFYLRIGKHLIWGIELNAQLRQSGAKQGDLICVTFLGKTPVTVLKEIKVNGQLEQEWVATHRNTWAIRIVH